MGLGRKFKPPKADAVEEWQVVELLYRHGLDFHNSYIKKLDYGGYTTERWPKTLKEAWEFVKLYSREVKSQ